MARYVYGFHQGNKDMKDLLGGKGANLAEMTNLGLPVPPGFTISTQACREYLAGGEPVGLRAEIDHHLATLETARGRRLGQADDPLLVSVRSGAKFSMPGMMDTILNIGLTDQAVLGLAEQSGSPRFAWDSYRRLLAMFGRTVLGVGEPSFDAALEAAKRAKGTSSDLDLDENDLRALVATYQRIVLERTGRPFPQDPREQLDLAIRAVFDSWNGPRARLYRRTERIPDDLGTAVSVVAMVFGNLGTDSGTGVAFTRDPGSGEPGVYGDYLPNAQGEDVVAGIRNPVPLAELERIDPASFTELREIMTRLEKHYRDLCDIEFTIEHGRLWILQTRVGKRTAAAAFRIAAMLAEGGVIDDDEALCRVSGDQLATLMFPRFDDTARPAPIATGVNAAPGAAVGEAVFDAAEAVRVAAEGRPVILVRRETNPDDLAGMLAARGILTSRGGRTSHAAVVARGLGRTCVCGAEEIEVDPAGRRLTTGRGVVVREGDILSIDGTIGAVYPGSVPLVPSPVVEYFEAGRPDHPRPGGDLVAAVDRLMRHADRSRRLRVRANADTGPDAARARRFGAAGIGLCRTEHMFLGDRRTLVEQMILAGTPAERTEALSRLLPPQREDFVEIFTAMDGLPVTVRLLDPPLHEFLPDLTELSVSIAAADAAGRPVDDADRERLAVLRSMHETNPMLGRRGVRLALTVPGLVELQARAIAEALVRCRRVGGDPRPEIMVPFISTATELDAIRDRVRGVLAEVGTESGLEIDLPIGTMIEVPRAALTADQIARRAEFFSFGTNDLTQLLWGFSRDDVEASLLPRYLDLGILAGSPFASVDRDGVGALMRTAVRAGRGARPDLGLGVCGEHGGDPDSVHFFAELGLDYVSCSPFRVPVARLEAGRAAVLGRSTVG
ncbi:pyruvate, phosphate dikinase [Frankia sp. CcI156]|uniref:Pyruvate, phosphate dikinase n=3 Tax=Frankia TaxID=1854 RepID=Q2JDI8_FRACC|nr:MULTISPECIES: pyruvate, phosphate dikinase [Frankia]ABD10654.1 pyruvate phosphate dikinase [Frankia casuarinae]ETA02918.1 pyruvate phosphate dikinase [Frankia sp. CcI6]EYT93408.1 pyruvate phosphate dikinase [Frankia casuarinae]KDA43527.1 pyruvate phosphate dikinase [Frankia sp. BMG5.23]OHV55250.1 pyruvate, phosphate dikinase [Frankia sp. CgIS1]